MKTNRFLMLVGVIALFAGSCRHPGHPRSIWSPGGRAVLPIERFPRGPAVVVLPSEAKRVVHRGVTYYRCNDVWYRARGGRYVVVRAPY